MSSHKYKVLILTTKWGHASIADGVKDALSSSKNLKVTICNIPVDDFSEKSYILFYRIFPKLYKIPFRASENKEISSLTKRFLKREYDQKIAKVFKNQKPDIVISTYFAFNWSIERLIPKYKFIFLNVVADPRTFHKLALTRKGTNFVFDKDSMKQAEEYGVGKNKLVVSGWFTKKEFYKPYSKKDIRKKLKIKPNAMTFVVVGGSAGTYNIIKIFPAFLRCKKRLHVIYICGKSENLKKTIKTLSELLSPFKNNLVKISVLGYKKNIFDYIKASDLVIGKAGPNLIFETSATITPFFAITHISGQEDGNLEIIKKYKLGFVEENAAESIHLLRKIINKPNKLKEYKIHLEKMSKHNNKSKDTLNNYIAKELEGMKK